MKLTNPEKMTLLMLAEIYEKLELSEFDVGLIRRAIYDDQTWAIALEMPGVVGRDHEPLPEKVRETWDILSMFEQLERSVAQLQSATAREQLSRELRFGGFDANHDEEYGIAQFTVNVLDRFDSFKSRAMNSHGNVLPRYRSLLERYKSIAGYSRNLDEATLMRIAGYN